MIKIIKIKNQQFGEQYVQSGELTSEDVLQWLIEQKTEDRIETVTRSMLESLLVNVQYLAVYFCKYSIDSIFK